MIPALLKTPANSERTSDLYAYISTENINKSEKPKSLCGQLRKCNLTKSSLVGGIILKEVCIDSLGTLECSLDWSIDFKLNGKKFSVGSSVQPLTIIALCSISLCYL